MEAHENIKQHSEELQEVFGTPPSWLVKYGTYIAIFTFLALIAVAYYVKYPDVIKAPLVITAPNPPVNIIAERNGLLEAVLFGDNEDVNNGDLLLIYSNSANIFDIDSLDKYLDNFSGEISTFDLDNFTPKRNLQLGELQQAYAAFIKDYDDYIYGSISKNDEKSINRLKSEIASLQNSIKFEESKRQSLINRVTTAKQDVKFIQDNYSTNPDRKRLSEAVKELNNAEQTLRDLDIRIDGKEIEIGNRRREISSVNQESGTGNSKLLIAITEKVNKLKGEIVVWRKENLVYAPISGRVVFYKEFDNDNQSVTIGTKVLQIIPPGEAGEMYGLVDLPQQGSAKVEEGQEVVIKLDNYPFQDFGMITGIVKSKATIPQENNTYKLEVGFENGLITSKGNRINFSQGMTGSAEIITQQKRFLIRVFDEILSF